MVFVFVFFSAVEFRKCRCSWCLISLSTYICQCEVAVDELLFYSAELLVYQGPGSAVSQGTVYESCKP